MKDRSQCMATIGLMLALASALGMTPPWPGTPDDPSAPSSWDPAQGPSGTSEFYYGNEDYLCVNINNPCPGANWTPPPAIPGDPCSYCSAPLFRSRCACELATVPCTDHEYRASRSPPGCGFAVTGGTVNNSGNCVGGVQSTTIVCYRLNCG
jgi:hypothetical protein